MRDRELVLHLRSPGFRLVDSVTQFVLGAALGEVVLKSSERCQDKPLQPTKAFKLGAFWLGGLVGTLPDLDVFFGRELSGPQALGFHRSFTHSIFFCTLFTPILAAIFARIFRKYGLSAFKWNLFVWLGLNTHWMIDSLTTYGTQVFLPFSDFPVNIGSVFIIDPLYTLPLALGLFWSLASSLKGRAYRSTGVKTGLIISTFYLCLTLGSKFVVLSRFQHSLEAKGVQYKSLISVATPFNSILWYGYADTGQQVLVADASIFDPANREFEWQIIDKGNQALADFGQGEADKRLLWFSRGFYRLEYRKGQPLFIDLRFGRLKSWFLPVPSEGDDHMFRFALKPNKERGPYSDFKRMRPAGGLDQFPWPVFWRRIQGKPALDEEIDS